MRKLKRALYGFSASSAILVCLAGVGASAYIPPEPAPPQTAPSATPPIQIVGLSNTDCPTPPAATPKPLAGNQLTRQVGNDLVVQLDATTVLNPTDWVLYLDGGPAVTEPDDTEISRCDKHGLLFHLRPTDKTQEAWTKILGSPDWTRKVTVEVGPASDPKLRLEGKTDLTGTFILDILYSPWLAVAIVLVGLITLALVISAVKTPILRDSLVPQIPPLDRPFSLGRCQMAFWFALIAQSFLFLWALLWDYNTVTEQSLILMGISASTGAGALLANETSTDSPAGLDKTLETLVAAGFNGPDDIKELKELEKKMKKATKEATAAQAAVVATQAYDAANSANGVTTPGGRMAIYKSATQDYVSATCGKKWLGYLGGIWVDIINDKDGPALHRLQLVGWTIALGAVFLVGVYRKLAMPAFSPTLLALIGVSGASYVGFKFPEKT